MTYVKKFEFYLNENESLNEEDYNLIENKSGRPTYTLYIGKKSYDKIKKYFDAQGRPIGKDMTFGSNGYSWSLYIIKRPKSDSGEEKWRLYGVSGDSTFGLAPTYYQQRLTGNKKVAKDVYDQFITKYLK